MATIQHYSGTDIPETQPIPSHPEARRSLPVKPSLWRLSSLESILDHKQAIDNEKRAMTGIVSRSTSDGASSEHECVNTISGHPFRSGAAEATFCLALGLAQLLAEYMISGFAVMLPTLIDRFSSNNTSSSFWPATILSLVLCSVLCSTARLSDMYGGYPIFMLSVLWLCVWCVIAGFSNSMALINICRAMQGLALAACTPSTFALFGSIYPTGPRRNLVLGIYSACAPLGFFSGIYLSSVLPPEKWGWYFWAAALMAVVALIAAYLSVPSDRTRRSSLDLTMDWGGSCAITCGLVPLVYALAASSNTLDAWKTPAIIVPFLVGLTCSAYAIYYETRVAKCPLIPIDFFSLKSVTPLMLASVFFYGSFGTWLYTTTNHLRLAYNVSGVNLAAWFAPMAASGFIFAILGTSVLNYVRPTFVLIFSGTAWVTAPLLMAFAKPSAGYWPFVFPAMICITLGIDITYTVVSVVLSSVSPVEWQGLAGAINSTSVNLGIAFSLAIAQVIQARSEGPDPDVNAQLHGHRNAYLFSAASAAVGLAITLVAVRIPHEVVKPHQQGEDSPDQETVLQSADAPMDDRLEV